MNVSVFDNSHIDTSLNARVAAITKRLTSKVEEAADGTGAVYELEYMLIEDSL